MKLSVCIVSYNTRDDLARCLDSLAATLGALDHEIVVVDNASADGSPALVREEYPHARLIEPGLNTFYSEGNNIAIRAARGDYVLILNPDTEVHPGAIQTLLDRLEANPGWGAVTARQIWTDGQTVLPICSRLNAYADLWLNYTLWGALLVGWRARRRARMWYQDWDRLSDRQVEVAPGSCLLARRERLLDIGLFDPAMPLFFSDDDLCARLRDAGFPVWYVAEAVITHAESASLRQVSGLARRTTFHDLGVYARKHFGRPRAALLMIFATPTRWLINAWGWLRKQWLV